MISESANKFALDSPFMDTLILMDTCRHVDIIALERKERDGFNRGEAHLPRVAPAFPWLLLKRGKMTVRKK